VSFAISKEPNDFMSLLVKLYAIYGPLWRILSNFKQQLTASVTILKGAITTGVPASEVFGETLCLPAGRQDGTFTCLTAKTKQLKSDLAVPKPS